MRKRHHGARVCAQNRGVTSTSQAPSRPEGRAARRNNVNVSGADFGTPMVFGHGFGCDQTMWRHLTPAFERDHRIVTFDHVGCGGSDLAAYDSAKYSTLRGYADDLGELLGELALGPVIYVGHSASGMIGLLAALHRPHLFRTLVLVGASPRYINDDDYIGGFSRDDIDGVLSAMDANFRTWAQALAPNVMGNPDRPELTKELEESFARTESKIAREFARAIFLSDYRRELDRVEVPTLIIQSGEDPMVPSEVGLYLRRHISGSTLVVLNTSGHYPQVSAADVTGTAIRDYLIEMNQ